MGIQNKEKCSRPSREAQSLTSSQRLFASKGVDFGDIFSPIAKLTSIRLLMYLDIVFDLEVEKMDIKI